MKLNFKMNLGKEKCEFLLGAGTAAHIFELSRVEKTKERGAVGAANRGHAKRS